VLQRQWHGGEAGQSRVLVVDAALPMLVQLSSLEAQIIHDALVITAPRLNISSGLLNHLMTLSLAHL